MTTQDQITIKNLETQENWNFQAEVFYEPDQVSCCLHAAIGAGGHSPDCQVVVRANQEAAKQWVEGYEKRKLSRTTCGKGDCAYPPEHQGGHKGACGCLAGCEAEGCPNVQ